MLNNQNWGAELGRDLAREVKAMINKKVAELNSKIEVLESKIVRLEATLEQRNFAYMGTWKDGKIYAPGSFVTHSGALWHSNTFHNTARPGNGDANWTLAVKGAGK